jgi:hypothetical protein
MGVCVLFILHKGIEFAADDVTALPTH